eukprot:639081-Rhodomonas_salina.2
MPGTELAYAAMGVLCHVRCERRCDAVRGTDAAYAATRRRRMGRRIRGEGVPILLRASYAMSGTDLAYAGMPGTCQVRAIRYGPGAIVLRAHYAVSGTDLAYAATRTGR